MWYYKELVSCPLILVLGKFSYEGLEGYATLPVLNLRLNILRPREGCTRIVSNIPYSEWALRLREVCLAVYENRLENLDLVKRVEATSMFYGGIGLYGVVDGNHVVAISLDFVDKKHYYFYLRPEPIPRRDLGEMPLENWVILQFALREGLDVLLLKACRDLTREWGECTIKTTHGDLVISSKELRGEGFLRVFPDNAPLRHVVAVE